MFKTKTLLVTATLNGEKAILRQRSDDTLLACSKIAFLLKQAEAAMTEKPPSLITATLESNRFASSRFVGGNLAKGHDSHLALTLALIAILRKLDHSHNRFFLFFFVPARLESGRFAGNGFVGGKLTSGHDKWLAVTLATIAILRKENNAHNRFFLFYFVPKPGLRAGLPHQFQFPADPLAPAR